MRKLRTLAMAGVLGSFVFAGAASAAPELQLHWSSSSIVLPGENAVLSIVLVADVPLSAATIMVGVVDKSAGAPKITAATNTPPAALGSVQFNITPAAPDGDEVGAFGGLSLGQLDPGTYTIGTVTFVAGAPGDYLINSFQRVGIDDWLDASAINIVIPILHDETLHVIPEPGTVALLGLGLVGLVAVGRRGRA